MVAIDRTKQIVGIIGFLGNPGGQVYSKIVGESIILEMVWAPCARGGYKLKSRDTREGRERRDVKSVDFYLVAHLSLVPLVSPHRPR
jgi:hypothetical protein